MPTSTAGPATDYRAIYDHVVTSNPSIKFICSVSPIPLKATFRFHDVRVATSYGKGTLRSALQEAIDDAHAAGMKHVDYFPSFEIVTYQRNNDVYKPVDKLGKPDCLHIREDFLDKTVKRVFSEAYLPAAAATGRARLAG